MGEAYACKEDTYLYIGETSTRCYTKQACPGFIEYNKLCKVREDCNRYWYEDDDNKLCLGKDGCEARSLIPFYLEAYAGFCIQIEQCPEKGGYVLDAESGKTCVNATTCSKSSPKGYAYEATRECSIQEPDSNGYFDSAELENHVYKCDSEHEYLD